MIQRKISHDWAQIPTSGPPVWKVYKWPVPLKYATTSYHSCILDSILLHKIVKMYQLSPFFRILQKSCLNLLMHIVWKLLEMSPLNFWILAFSANFCPIKTDLSGNTVWPQTSGFQKLAKMDHFGDFALTFVHSKRSSLFLWFSNTVPLISTWIIKFSIVLQPMTRRVGWKETHRAHNGGRAQPILHAGPSLGHLHQSLASYRQHAW